MQLVIIRDQITLVETMYSQISMIQVTTQQKEQHLQLMAFQQITLLITHSKSMAQLLQRKSQLIMRRIQFLSLETKKVLVVSTLQLLKDQALIQLMSISLTQLQITHHKVYQQLKLKNSRQPQKNTLLQKIQRTLTLLILKQ